MPVAGEKADVIRDYLETERNLGRIIGPVHPDDTPPGTHVSPLFVVPKPRQPGKWRLIVHLSSPEDYSVNAGIESELCSLRYLRLDDVISNIARRGRGTQLAKMDIASAYRMVPVHPGDRPLLAMEWEGSVFFNTRLPFGLRSAPKIFTAVADALQWCCLQQGVSWLALYLDDYITMGDPVSRVPTESGDTTRDVSPPGRPCSSSEVCRASHSHRFPWLRVRHLEDGGETPPR